MKILVTAAVSLIFFASCKKEVLDEKPLDFYSVSNAYITPQDFQTAINWLYSETRSFLKVDDDGAAYYYGTDMSVCPIDGKPLNNYSLITPANPGPMSSVWARWYKVVADANVIITRIDKTSFDNTTRSQLKAEAKFFRAFAYRNLADLFGGVPLDTVQTTVARRDFTRATRDEVFQLCANDLRFAAANLKDVTATLDGQVNKATANHLLSEIYISLKQWDNAITAANAAINNPAMRLMTSRFGVKTSQPGDVISDLFRDGNYNKSQGNTEGLWVLQWGYKNAGSLVTNNDYQWGGNYMQGFTNPFYTLVTLTDKKLAIPTALPELGGQGLGWLKPTTQAATGVFQNSPEDLRNSSYNIIRDAKVTNPNSVFFGKYLIADNLLQPADVSRNWYPIYTKSSRWNDFLPENHNPTGELGFGVSTNKPIYLFRLAETYLLRAEAYLGKGDKQNAANDINVVRARANAKPVTPAEVDIDYILDERLRELPFEELRILTLCRLDKLVDRVRRFNSIAGPTIKDYNNLMPIPYSEIEVNTGAKISQNPGY